MKPDYRTLYVWWRMAWISYCSIRMNDVIYVRDGKGMDETGLPQFVW